MRTARFALCFVTALAMFAADGRAQIVINGNRMDLPQMPGMPRGQVKTGTGRILGRVVAAETGAAVRRAQVRISGTDIGAKSALTDADGRYEFRDLPAGRFSLTAQKSGYMTVQYGQTRPFESGKSIELAEGQMVDKAEIAMPRGSVISGRIVDEFGDPVADASVSAMRSVWSNGKRRLQQTGRNAQTNDLGQYRLFGLAPGEYYVSATYRGADMAIMEMAMITAGAGGGPSGSTPTSGYAPTYFPGTTSGADAQRITVGVGQEAQGTDFSLLPVRFAKISRYGGQLGREADRGRHGQRRAPHGRRHRLRPRQLGPNRQERQFHALERDAGRLHAADPRGADHDIERRRQRHGVHDDTRGRPRRTGRQRRGVGVGAGHRQR